MPLYSTVRLFGFCFDASKNGFTGREWFFVILHIARWLAVIPTGHALYHLLRPLTAPAVTTPSGRKARLSSAACFAGLSVPPFSVP